MSSLELLAPLTLAIGLWMLWGVWRRRKERLSGRILPYLQEAQGPASPGFLHWFSRLLRPVWEQLGSTHSAVATRLSEVGLSPNVERFRLWQFLSALTSAGLVTALGALLNTVRPIGVATWLVLVIVAFCAGPLMLDRFLTYWVKRENQLISQQVADAAQLLALSISAGESIPAALARVSRVCGPELARQLDYVVQAMESGVAQSRALASLAQRTHSVQLARLLDSLITASDRGAPLATVLREQARDLRDEARRNLLESGGRREIAMMVPVVFVILPITILFALYPGLVALDL